MMNSKIVFNNLIWRFLERCGAQGVSFIVSIVLARLLEPSVYGTVAIIIVFTTILQVFVDSGMGNALIQKKDADDLDFSSVFYFNMGICVIVYILLFVSAPAIATFYNNEQLVSLLRVLGITVVVSGIKNVQQAYVSRNLQFRLFFYSTLCGTITAAMVGIWLAYSGYGVWALIAQYLVNSIIDTTVLWITVRWRPKLMFSYERLRGLFSYGWKLLVSALIDVGYRDMRQLIIGKVYTSSDLAYYNRGEQLPNLIISNINTSIDSVLLPAMSSVQDSRDSIRKMTRKAIKTSTYIIMPAMMGLAVCAEPLVTIVLTEKWLPCVFFLRIFCFTYSFYPIHTANLNAIKALGRSDIFLKLEVIKKVIGLIALISTMFISVQAIAYSLLITTFLSQIINSWPNKKLLDYSYIEQFKDMVPQILLSCIMGGIVYSITLIGLSDWLTVLIQIPLGIIIYFLGSILCHIDSYYYIQGIIKSYIRKTEQSNL